MSRVTNRCGFTLIEVLIVVVILGILINIAVPLQRQMRRRAEAAAVIGDIRAIQVAALATHADQGVFPATEGWGVVPALMTPTLPDGFDFRSAGALYRWHRFSLPDGLPAFPGQTTLLAVEVQTSDANLASAIRGLYRGRITFGSATNIFFVLQ